MYTYKARFVLVFFIVKNRRTKVIIIINIHTYIHVDLCYNININKRGQEDMKVNKTIYINLSILQEMLEYCEKNNIKISALIENLWKAYKKTYKK